MDQPKLEYRGGYKYDDVKDGIVRAYQKGATLKESVEIMGVSEQSLHNWRNKYPDFDAALSAIKDDLRHKAAVVLAKHMEKVDNDSGLPTDSAAKTAQWISERLDKTNFSQKTVVEHSGGISLGTLIEAANTTQEEETPELDSGE